MTSIKGLLISIIILFLAFLCVACSQSSETTTSPDTSNNPPSYQIVFYSGRSGNSEINRMDDLGENLINLSNHPSEDTCPAVSPNGEMIAFVSDRDGVDNIYMMTIQGENVVKITNSETNITHPSWSYDGTKLVYIVDYNEYTEIWSISADGTNPTKLTDNPYRDERPEYSPNGEGILFMSNRDGRYKIFLMSMDGFNQREIEVIGVEDSYSHFVFPQWHPDGEHIIYSLNNLSNQQASIHIVNLDGSNDIALTEANGRNENPSWSEDGQWIVFQSERDGNFEIHKMRSDGSEVQRLTNHSAWDGWASWVN